MNPTAPALSAAVCCMFARTVRAHARTEAKPSCRLRTDASVSSDTTAGEFLQHIARASPRGVALRRTTLPDRYGRKAEASAQQTRAGRRTAAAERACAFRARLRQRP